MFDFQNLSEGFAARVKEDHARTAVYWEGVEVSYGRLMSQAGALAELLRREYGVQPGTTVGLWMRNCPEFISAFFGILMAGGIVVPLNHFLKPPEIAALLADAEATFVLTERRFEESAGLVRDHLPRTSVLFKEDFPETTNVEASLICERGRNDPAVIIYTSGTTGRAKGVLLSHGNLLCNVQSCSNALGNIDRERFILLLPMFHSFMLCVGVLLPLLSGATVLLISSIQKPRLIIQDILRLRGTILPAIPQFFRALTDPSVPAELPLRLCISGAAPLPVAVLEMFKKKFKFPLLEGYGLSEASPVVSLNPVKGPWKAGSIGLPLPGVEVRITDENVDDLPTGEVGELTVRGGNVMNGYWKRPDEAAKVLKRGWLFTGDMGYKDRDGYIYITGRRKEMLLVNGINVYPREIEEALSEFPGIVETAVVGINDNRRGEQPFAFYVADGGTDLDASTLIEFLRGRLADYKVPRKFRRLDALPRNETGKIQKGRLKEMAGAALD